MVKVKNQSTLWLLTLRFLKINRGRNAIAILAIILTTLLFTSLFTGAASMMLSKLAADQKTYSSWSHAVLQDITEEDAKRIITVLQETQSVKQFGMDTFVGLVQDERIMSQTEVRAADFYAAKSFGSIPTKGRLPENINEIAISTVTLDALELPREIGTKISFNIWLDTAASSSNVVSAAFTLCGWWEGDISDHAQYAWVSQDFADAIIPHSTQEALGKDIKSGTINFSVWFQNLWNLDEKAKQLGERCGFIQTGIRGKGFQVNPAYGMLFGEGGIPFAGIAVLILFIILAGYLIIYNIFNISVQTDIRAYGLLKNVGTSGKQLAQIVRMQAFCLCLVGIPIGLLLGYLGGRLLSPLLTADIDNIEQVPQTIISAHPLIFIASVFFALITVYLSAMQACRIVARVSPVEALRIAQGGKSSYKTKQNTNVSWWGMALYHFRQNWKKGSIVMLSIAISLITLNAVFIMVRGYNINTYKDIYLSSDFELDKLPDSAEYANFHGITKEMQTLLNACPFAQQVGYVRYSQEYHEMEPHLLATWDLLVPEMLNDYWQEVWVQMKAENQMEIILIGVSQSIFEKLQWRSDAPTWEEFQSGNYAIVDYPLFSIDGASNYQVGDNIAFSYQSGVKKDYTVLGEAMLPYSLGYPYTKHVSVTIILPENEFIACTGNTTAMRAAIEADTDSEKKVDQYLKETILSNDSTLLLHSILDLQNSFGRFLKKYYIVGGALAVVLAFIGIINFFNTTAASVLNRKRELALLEVVGMTKKQIQKMLTAEGCLYLGGAVILAIAITYLYGGKLLSVVLGQAFYFQISVTALPSIALIPVLTAIAFAIPEYQFYRVCRQSVVERINGK